MAVMRFEREGWLAAPTRGTTQRGPSPREPLSAPRERRAIGMLCSIGEIIAGVGEAGEIWHFIIQQFHEISIESGRFAASQVH